MSDITITVSEEQLTKLKSKSSSSGIKLEDLILLSIEELLSRPDEDFQQAMKYVLQKNAELYRRLA
jgi:hypothetical protein